MVRLDVSDSDLRAAVARRPRRQLARTQLGVAPLADPVPWDCPATQEIRFDIPEHYNASEVLFQNLAAGRGDHLAVI